MSENTDRLKVSRGKGYYTVLRLVLAEIGQAMLDDARAIKAERGGISLLDIGRLAVRYDLNLKATMEWLAEGSQGHIIPTGAYDMCVDGGMKARQVLEAARQAEA